MGKNSTLQASQFSNQLMYDSIDNDFILLENPIIDRKFFDPFKLEHSVGVICAEGSMKIKINVREYEVKAPCLLSIISGQFVQYQEVSPDLKAYYVVMSDQFTDKLFSDLRERYPLKHAVLDNPLTVLSEADLQSQVDYFQVMRDTLRMENNPFRKEIIQHLTLAYFYKTTAHQQTEPKDSKKPKFDILFDSFLNLVQQNFRKSREVEFYANELCITPKYFSKVLKEKTGKTASDWISEYVIMEASSLIKSTNLSIQQISDQLNFPSQSFFGKYFKQHTGVSPKEFRSKGKSGN